MFPILKYYTVPMQKIYIRIRIKTAWNFAMCANYTYMYSLWSCAGNHGQSYINKHLQVKKNMHFLIWRKILLCTWMRTEWGQNPSISVEVAVPDSINVSLDYMHIPKLSLPTYPLKHTHSYSCGSSYIWGGGKQLFLLIPVDTGYSWMWEHIWVREPSSFTFAM